MSDECEHGIPARSCPPCLRACISRLISPECWNLFIEAHGREHEDSRGIFDSEESTACPFCEGDALTKVMP